MFGGGNENENIFVPLIDSFPVSSKETEDSVLSGTYKYIAILTSMFVRFDSSRIHGKM